MRDQTKKQGEDNMPEVKPEKNLQLIIKYWGQGRLPMPYQKRALAMIERGIFSRRGGINYEVVY